MQQFWDAYCSVLKNWHRGCRLAALYHVLMLMCACHSMQMQVLCQQLRLGNSNILAESALIHIHIVTSIETKSWLHTGLRGANQSFQRA